MKRLFYAFILTVCLAVAIGVQSADAVEPSNGPSHPNPMNLPHPQS
ncbi:hypothetical protein [Shouchella lonarensis]|uniref:Uncharacterized protein n=1 Tax=Shouchella lonarensis TaxID=1464122 RepID=A0A1G6H9U8_9BACI|nr:hypothetical protein [Shouchella lonarensis]SDB90914.1 hypothetical protein SAMN05421737_10392 [Shouchella lonarensis]